MYVVYSVLANVPILIGTLYHGENGGTVLYNNTRTRFPPHIHRCPLTNEETCHISPPIFGC